MTIVNTTAVKRLLFVREILSKIRHLSMAIFAHFGRFFIRMGSQAKHRFAQHPYQSWQMSIASLLLIAIL